MISYEVRLTEQARSDLKNVFEYVAFKLMAPNNAETQLRRIENAILDLKIFPERFQCYSIEPWKSRGLRIRPIDNYLILYIFVEGKSVIQVMRVMYCGQDLEGFLNNVKEG